MHRRNHHTKHVFSWVSLNPRTTHLPTNRPPTTFPAIHRLPTQWLTESTIIFRRLSNRNIFMLQNTSTAGKIYNYTSVYYPKSLLVSIKHMQRRQLYLFFYFLNFNLYSSPDIQNYFLLMNFFSVQSMSIMFHEVIDLPKLFVVKTWTFCK